MKKALLFLAATLMAGPAFGAILNSKHDLSGTGFGGGYQAGTNAETCVYCHTPHGADTTVTSAPLWNRDLTNVLPISDVYIGANLNATITTGSAEATDVLLCLSCHDGTSMADGLVNPPNDAGFTALVDPTDNILGTSTAVLDSDLSNDHPIGFTYDAALVAADGGLRAKNLIEVGAMAGALSFSATKDQMWCSSCHDVHNSTNVPFLRISNAGSALCTSCHLK